MANQDLTFRFKDLWLLFPHDGAIVLNQDQKEILDLVKELEPFEINELKRILRDKHFNRKTPDESSESLNNGYLNNPGDRGEQIVYEYLLRVFWEKRVKWTSSKNPKVGSYCGTCEYDFTVSDINEQYIQYYIDAKSTS